MSGGRTPKEKLVMIGWDESVVRTLAIGDHGMDGNTKRNPLVITTNGIGME